MDKKGKCMSGRAQWTSFATLEILSKYIVCELLLLFSNEPLAGNAVSESLWALTEQKLEHIVV